MFTHVVVGSNDLQRSKQFYDKLFAALGAGEGVHVPPPVGATIDRIAYNHGGLNFVVSQPINGEPATHANGGTIGFGMTGAEQADAWHAAGIAAGGQTCEDPPGVRDMGFAKLYLAYLRDPDGNKLCALCPAE